MTTDQPPKPRPGRSARPAPSLLRRVLRAVRAVVLTILAIWAAMLVAYRWIDPPATPLMLIRLVEEGRLDYRPRDLDQIARALPNSAIAAEDNNFCSHFAVDWNAVGEAIDEWRDGRPLRGASTITMQTARNLFLWPGGGFLRKALEVPLAFAIEILWPKWRIIELYVNVAEMGPGLYGAEAAAQTHFGKPAAALTAREAALLAAVLPNPRRWSASEPTRYIQRRAGVITRRVGQLGPATACAAPPA
ncbi:monofunctional biosynthetic peptidoglycan transglycosylase [Tistrella mobilis]|uniref:monofunctional biosynthetic peptidoglycan transglycosylase n=1 Tax=Tistrella mobilis TaxID=171437 RepID=UPI000AF4CA60|nr:monofunctional biosynthetic peptidoglycan transglycosylase [Tistrella mobilis]